MEPAKLAVWADMVQTEALLKALLAPFAGALGVVLNEPQQTWDAGQKFTILNYPKRPLKSTPMAILGSRDEPNVPKDGPSGPYIPPATVIANVMNSRAQYKGTPVTNGGLAFRGTTIETALDLQHFDKNYWLQIKPLGGPYAFNAGDTRLPLVKAALASDPGPWIVTGEPRRPAWTPQFTVLAWLVQSIVGVSVNQWVALSIRADIIAVCIWCLLQDGNQTGFGIWRPSRTGFRLTGVGRALYFALGGHWPLPRVTL